MLSTERFDLLNNYFKCDYILKSKRIRENESKNYDIFSAHFRLIFIPTLKIFKTFDNQSIDDFKKNQNIIYDIYLRQCDTKIEFLEEIINILKESPHLLKNMGVTINLDNSANEISNYIKNFKFYIPTSNNKKNAKEMTDFIFSDEAIERIKSGEKLTENDLDIIEVEYSFSINHLFNLNSIQTKNNIDERPRGIFFVEYIPFEKSMFQNLSIFEIKNNSNIAMSNEELENIKKEKNKLINDSNKNNRPSDSYNLDNYALDNDNNRHGLVGLNNLGNTCYMNTGMQCLSNCKLLTNFFLSNYYKDYINKSNPIGSQGQIVEKYSQLIQHLWRGNNECISPIQFKLAFGKVYSAFNDFRQQDCQEFISFLLDALHEDLNKVLKKPYIENQDIPENLSDEEHFKIKKKLYLSRNQSFIADLIYGFYKSTIYCPNEKCINISKYFEPFNMITLSLTNEAEIKKLEEYKNEENKKIGITVINITFIPFKIKFKPLKFPFKLKRGMDIFTFKKIIEILTGFNKNSFEIYKIQDSEFLPIKPNIILLEDFLEEENKLFLFQIPPYVFDKPSDYFDKVYIDLNNDHSKFYIGQEKLERLDFYELDNNRDNSIIMKAQEEEEKRIMEDNLKIDKKIWIKAEFYNYSYSDKNNKEKVNEEYRINNSKIIYINKGWANTRIYKYILEMLEGKVDNLIKIEEEWFQNAKEITKNFKKMQEDGKKINIFNFLEEVPNHPLILQYMNVFNFNKNSVNEKREKWKNVIFPYDPESYFIQTLVNAALAKNNDIEEIELLFKITWNPIFSKIYIESTIPIELIKYDRWEYEKDRRKLKEMEDKENNKKLKLEELLKNFNEIEQLSKDNKWYCPKCKQFQLANKKMEIYSVNEIIIIHLKRFKKNRKIKNLVEFPIEGLDLSEFLPKKDEKNIYDLFAVANHIGELNLGHYYAYCKNFIEGDWYEFNDSNVYKIEKKKVMSDSAYILFYNKRRDEKINEEELFTKPYIKIDLSNLE